MFPNTLFSKQLFSKQPFSKQPFSNQLFARRPNNTTDTLRSISLFRGLDEQALRSIASTCDVAQFARGDVLFHEGATGHYAYVIQHGEVDVIVGDTTIATIESGDIVGEMALIDRAPRSAGAIARTPVRAIAIEVRQFAALIDDHPLVARHLLTALSERVRALDALLYA